MNEKTLETSFQFGRAGAVMVDASSAQSGKDYSCVEFVEAGSFSAFTGTDMTGTWTGKTFQAGTRIVGHITAYTASVATIAYNDPTK